MSLKNRFIRQQEFINKKDQEKLKKTTIFLAGCGAGSAVAQNLVRVGIGNFILADPDKVELHNLNRQDYIEDDVSSNKAKALSNRIRKINKTARVTVLEQGVTLDNVNELVEKADIIIDMIDVGAPEIALSLHIMAEKYNKPVITGFDIGESIIIYVFDYRDSSNLTFQEFLGFDNITLAQIRKLSSFAIAAQFVIGKVENKFKTFEEGEKYYSSFFEIKKDILLQNLPDEFQDIVDKILNGQLSFIPQINTAAAVLGALQSLIVKEIIIGRKVKIAPDSVRLNLLNIVNF